MNQNARYNPHPPADKYSVGSPVEEPQSEPLMAQAVREAFAALEELAASVEWLLQKIEPVCQEPRVGGSESCGSSAKELTATPSNYRAKLMNLKGIAEGISARISSVRYTIEI